MAYLQNKYPLLKYKCVLNTYYNQVQGKQGLLKRSPVENQEGTDNPERGKRIPSGRKTGQRGNSQGTALQ